MFNHMPVAALIDDRIFCVHGGLSPELDSLEKITQIARPTDVPNSGLLCDLLWSDPCHETVNWKENDRGVSYIFCQKHITDFLENNYVDLICRAHQVVEDGYEFFGDKSLVTLFSAPDYCNEFTNSGGMMIVNEELICSFKILKPLSEKEMKEDYYL